MIQDMCPFNACVRSKYIPITSTNPPGSKACGNYVYCSLLFLNTETSYRWLLDCRTTAVILKKIFASRQGTTCSSSTLMERSGLVTTRKQEGQATCRESLSGKSWRERGIVFHGLIFKT